MKYDKINERILTEWYKWDIGEPIYQLDLLLLLQDPRCLLTYEYRFYYLDNYRRAMYEIFFPKHKRVPTFK